MDRLADLLQASSFPFSSCAVNKPLGSNHEGNIQENPREIICYRYSHPGLGATAYSRIYQAVYLLTLATVAQNDTETGCSTILTSSQHVSTGQ